MALGGWAQATDPLMKAGRVEFKLDKNANIAVPVGKFSFDVQKLVENGSAVIDAVIKALNDAGYTVGTPKVVEPEKKS